MVTKDRPWYLAQNRCYISFYNKHYSSDNIDKGDRYIFLDNKDLALISIGI